MTERGMIFNADMVRAVLDGRMTQTRRIMKVQPVSVKFEPRFIIDSTKRSEIGKWCWAEPGVFVNPRRSALFSCPFGAVGDRLWVRETWSEDFANYYPNDRVWYAADDDRRLDIEIVDGVRGIYSPESDVHVPFRWRPSIHMPRRASRITLEITGVRVERLNDISEDDAKAEGAPTECCVIGDKHFLGFRSLWRCIYGADSWQANPWVWVIEFKRVEGQ